MNDLQRRLDDLRRQLQDGDINLTELERTARALLSDSKNTPYESAAQTLFAEIARMGVRPRDTGTTRRCSGNCRAGTIARDRAIGDIKG